MDLRNISLSEWIQTQKHTYKMVLLVGNSGQEDEICTDRKHIGACAGSVLTVVCKEDAQGNFGDDGNILFLE